VANSLSHSLGLTKQDVMDMLEKTGIDPQRRAETFTLEEWAGLWKVFGEEYYQ